MKLKSAIRMRLRALLTDYDNARAALRDLADQTLADMRDAYEERSNHWKESAAGQEASDKLDTFEAWIEEIPGDSPNDYTLDDL